MIVTCAFREPYLSHNIKQLETLTGVPVLSFRDCLPYAEGLVTENIVERFQKSLYGFKPHAIQKARDMGATKVIWMDPSVYPLESVQTIYDQLDKHPMLVIKGDRHIKDMTSERLLHEFTFGTPKLSLDVNHIGGTIYAFNFEDKNVRNAFHNWKAFEIDGFFGDQTEFMKGHWADESCLALCLAHSGVEQVSLNFKYRNQKND